MSARPYDDDAAAEQASRERLAAGLAAYKAVPKARRTPVSNPAKYAFPIGVDDDGNPLPIDVQPGRS